LPQLNLNINDEFQRNLVEYMRLCHLKTKSEAIRQALREALARERSRRQSADFTTWLALGNRAPQNPNPRFHSDDDLWSPNSPTKSRRSCCRVESGSCRQTSSRLGWQREHASVIH
jgi:hypothetical protein